MNILFDVDETLSILDNEEDIPVNELCDLIETLSWQGHTVYVASGGGVDYATRRCEFLRIEEYVTVVPKDPEIIRKLGIDISFDDQETRFGKVNCKVSVRLV